MMTKRSTSADFVTAFATGWPENQPDIMVLSLTTNKGVQDFALNKEQALWFIALLYGFVFEADDFVKATDAVSLAKAR